MLCTECNKKMKQREIKEALLAGWFIEVCDDQLSLSLYLNDRITPAFDDDGVY